MCAHCAACSLHRTPQYFLSFLHINGVQFLRELQRCTAPTLMSAVLIVKFGQQRRWRTLNYGRMGPGPWLISELARNYKGMREWYHAELELTRAKLEPAGAGNCVGMWPWCHAECPLVPRCPPGPGTRTNIGSKQRYTSPLQPGPDTAQQPAADTPVIKNFSATLPIPGPGPGSHRYGDKNIFVKTSNIFTISSPCLLID